MKKEDLVFRSKIKANENMILEGYVVKWNELSNNVGGYYEKVVKGAFSNSLENNDIKALYQHDETKVLGSNSSGSLELFEDDIGLKYKIKLNNTTWAKDCYECAADLDGVSFGFYVIDSDTINENGSLVVVLKEVDLQEISFVTYPAYPSSEINKRNMKKGCNKMALRKRMIKIKKDLISRSKEYKIEKNSGMLGINPISKKINEYAVLEEEIKRSLKDNSCDKDVIESQIDDLEELAEEIAGEIESELEQRNKVTSREMFLRARDFKSEVDFKRRFGADNEENSVGKSKFIRGLLFNDWNGEEFKLRTSTDGSVIAPTDVASEIIFNAMQKSVLLGNCPILPMKEGVTLVGRISDSVDADFKGRGEYTEETLLSLEGLVLDAKTVYAYVELPEEDLEDISNLDNIAMRALSEAVAKTVDENFLYTNKNYDSSKRVYPKGILDTKGVNEITVDTCDYDMIGKASLEIAKNNGVADTVGLNPIQHFNLQMLKDSNNQYIKPPEFYNQLTKVASNGIRENEAVVFDSNQILIGVRKTMDIKKMPNIKNGCVWLRVMFRVDVVAKRENHICRIKITQE